MEQPKFPNPSTTPKQQQEEPSKPKKPKMKLPTPQELITHYETQGMTTQEASVKVIDDLQHALFRVVTSRKGKNENAIAGDVPRKLDNLNARLAIVERKLDSKPGLPQCFLIGFGSVAAFRGVAAVLPQVAGGFASIWNSVRGSTSTKT